MTRSLLVSCLLLLLGLSGCSDNTLSPLWDPTPPPLSGDEPGGEDEEPPDGDDDDLTDFGDPFDDGQGDDDDLSQDPPDPWLDDCPPEAIQATDFYGPDGEDEILVLSWGEVDAEGTLVAPVSGLFAVYDTLVYESGATQTNESGYLRVRNEASVEGLPGSANCDDEFIVQDGDNSGAPPAPLIYLGTFDLVEGPNELSLHHYCQLYRQGQCESFHIGSDSGGSSCNSSNPNSLHLTADGICLVPR